MRVSDYIIERISKNGTEYIFQVTGRGSLFLNDAVAKSNKIKAISMHHEQSCSFAAIGYAEQTGKLGACLISTGCASTNAITGLLCAWQDNVPCIFISGQNTLKETTNYTGAKIRTYGQQEADIISIVKPITKYARMVKSSTEIVDVLEEALFEAQHDRKGPVWIDIPLDIQSSQIKEEFLISNFKPLKKENILSNKDFNYLKDELYKANRPIILIGSGIRSAKAENELSKFIKNNNIPLTYTSSATDIYGFKNELSIGSVGSMGCSRSGNFAVQNSDLLIVLGSRLTSLTTGSDYCSFAREAKIIVVDIDSNEHMKNTIKINRFIKADVFSTLNKLNSITLNKNFNEWTKKCQHWKNLFNNIEENFDSKKEIDLYQLSKTLGEILPDESSIVTDSGLIEVILPNNICFSNKMRCIHPNSQGSMGFAIPAAIGTYFASRKNVIVVVGDGSIMMNLQELEVIKYHKLPIKIIVISNNVYSIIRRRQKDLFRKRTIGTDPQNGVSCPNFQDVAACFKLNYFQVNHINKLDETLISFLKSKGPSICEIFGKDDQDYIEVSHAKSAINGKLVRRPLEDQKPFLDRELITKEMIIDPIDL